MRPIDADALIDRWNGLLAQMRKTADGMRPVDFRAVIVDISKQPTIEAEPVKHGRWETTPILRTDPDGDWVALEYHCSLCNRLEYRKENYCPNCGAKMDGGSDG